VKRRRIARAKIISRVMMINCRFGLNLPNIARKRGIWPVAFKTRKIDITIVKKDGLAEIFMRSMIDQLSNIGL
jgi:hypothetical protein